MCLARHRLQIIPETWELEFGIILNETGRKTGLSGYRITLDF